MTPCIVSMSVFIGRSVLSTPWSPLGAVSSRFTHTHSCHDWGSRMHKNSIVLCALFQTVLNHPPMPHIKKPCTEIMYITYICTYLSIYYFPTSHCTSSSPQVAFPASRPNVRNLAMMFPLPKAASCDTTAFSGYMYILRFTSFYPQEQH